jgi:predicted Zn-dependent protease
VAAVEAANAGSRWAVNRDQYWQRLNGLVFGDDPREGVVRGREFIHPELRFRRSFPQGWAVENGKQQVTARPREEKGALMSLELVPDAQAASLESVARGSMQKAGFTQLGGESARLNGIPAYVGVYDGQTQDGQLIRVRAAHIRHEGRVFLLAGVASRSRYPQVEPAFADAILTFAPVDAGQAARITPNRIGFASVRAGDTWQGIAERTGGLIPAGDLAVLNGFAVNETPPAGQRIKIVIAGQ